MRRPLDDHCRVQRLLLGTRNPLTAEQQGIFYVRADGTGLRRLGPPSQEPAQRILFDLADVYDFIAYAIPSLAS